MDWWLCLWRILETVTSSLETFSILKEKIFNPEYNTDIKHSGNLMEHHADTIYCMYHLIISQWYCTYPN
jgi:hypothetical protein